MADRTTRKMVENEFKTFAGLMGRPVAHAYNEVGAYTLDYSPTYGGYVVVEITSEHGAQRHPFGNMRRSPRAMWETLDFAIQALDRQPPSELVEVCREIAALNEGQGRMNMCEVAGHARQALARIHQA
jgi:hypothetical protein